MYFSRKNILTKGKKPLYAASRVLNASSAHASSAFSRCWVHSTNKTSALIRTVRNQGFRRAYSTTKNGAEGGTTGGGLPPGGIPLYRAYRISPLSDHLLAHAASLLFWLTGKLMTAWTETPTKWYPLPLAVGALLLVAMQYRRKSKRVSKEVDLDENGQEVIRLKGPWQVSTRSDLYGFTVSKLYISTKSRYTFSAHFLSATCPVYGAMSTP